MIVRGKGNLSVPPPALEFTIKSHLFTANGHNFDVGQAVGFAESTITIDDLLNPPPPAGEARTSARDLIMRELIDGDWHDAAGIIELCAEREIGKRAAQRAAKDIGIETRKQGFPATTSWRLQRRQPEEPPCEPVIPVTSGTSRTSRSASDDRGDKPNPPARGVSPQQSSPRFPQRCRS